LNPSDNIDNSSRDIIGVGIRGDGNIIGKNITVFKSEVLNECGLSFLYPDYFK